MLIFNAIIDRFLSKHVPVLNQPVVLTVVRAVAHSQDAMIQVLTAAFWLVVQAYREGERGQRGVSLQDETQVVGRGCVSSPDS